jgi:SAM-dependent methyltransferase
VNPNLADWLVVRPLASLGKRTLVVGCGLGDDAEHLAALALHVTAFDISATAIAWCRQRFPDSAVNYRVADLLDPPFEWQAEFDFIFEAYTLQALPPELRARAIVKLAGLLAPGGLLLVVARARQADEPVGTLPWPLTREDLAGLNSAGLETQSLEEYFDLEDPPVRRFRATYRRPQ